MLIDKPYWAVFNPTANDWENSNETIENAQKDTQGKRYWLSKKVGSEGYSYEGVGKYTNGPIADIPAMYLIPTDLEVLAATWRYTPMDFYTAKTVTPFQDSENTFKKCFLYTLEFAMLQNSAKPSDIEAAHTALATTLTALNGFDFDNAYLQLKNATIGTSLTQATKDNMIDLIEDYLKKFPR